MTQDLRMVQHQFITAVESGVSAAETIRKAKAEGKPAPRTRRPLDLNVDHVFSNIFSTAEATQVVTRLELAKLYGQSEDVVTGWSRSEQLPPADQREEIIRRLCDHIRFQRDAQAGPKN